MSEPSFDELVQASVQEAMSKMLGSEVWKGISFYFDLKTLSREPGMFEKLMNSLFREFSTALQQSIGETLFSKLGVDAEAPKGLRLPDWIDMARARFGSAAKAMSLKR